MDPTRDTAERIESRDFGAIEDAWLEHLDTNPTDLEYFLPVAKAMADGSQIESARPLLRLLEEELSRRGAHEERLQFFLEAGPLVLRPNPLHEEVVDVLRALYSKSDSLDDMMRIAGLHQGTTDARTLRLQVGRLRSLMLLDVGSLVHMEGKGVGTITEINFDLGRYKVDFERIPALTIGFKAGAKLMKPIPHGHILRAKMEELERLEKLRDEQPSELLREVLESYDHPMTGAEIKTALEGVVSPGRWARWWTAARNHPQVLVTSDKRQRYHWAESSDDAAGVLREAFVQADLDGKLEIFSKNARQNPELAQRMAERLNEMGAELAASDPANALSIWFQLARVGLDDQSTAFSPETIVATTKDVPSLVREASSRGLRESLYQAIRETRSDWVELTSTCALAEEEPQLVATLVESLTEADPAQRDKIVDAALNRPQRHPGAFVWLAQAAAEDADLRASRTLRLFRQLLASSNRPQLSSYRNALAPMLESGGTLPKLVADLSDDEAPAALEAVKRAPMEDYLRAPLVTAIELRFSSLRVEESETLYALQASIDRKDKEARNLHEVEIPENRKAIQEAAALGDLRENFEYKSARQRHEYLSARLANLSDELARAQPIDTENLSNEEVRIGSRITLDGSSGSRQLTILGPWESDPEGGIISYQSELGRSLIGSRAGDRVELEEGEFEISEVAAFVEQ